MPDTTDIEKKSLEAHVELCAERYRHLETKLEVVEKKITDLGGMIGELHNAIVNVKDSHNGQLMTWGGIIIATLVGIIAWFFVTYMT
jgi:phage-related minor tail protein